MESTFKNEVKGVVVMVKLRYSESFHIPHI